MGFVPVQVWDEVGFVPVQVWDKVGFVPVQVWDEVGFVPVQVWLAETGHKRELDSLAVPLQQQDTS